MKKGRLWSQAGQLPGKNLQENVPAVKQYNFKIMINMRKIFLLAGIIFPLLVTECRADNPVKGESIASAKGEVTQLTTESFKKLIFNYDDNKEWKYEGTKPAIIDFYADWCGPCRQLSPLVEEIAKQYEGKIMVYKVDTDKESVLAQSLGITGLPTLLFIPATGKPQMAVGALPKETLLKAVNEVLLVK
jgi:thioredoxin 1